MKLLWDCLGTEFGGRHELYEINYSGSTEEIRRYALFGAMGNGNAAKFKGFAEQCMAEYDLDGWTAPDLINPDDLSLHGSRKARSSAKKAGPKTSAKSSSSLKRKKRASK
jgi:4-hydroxyphenylacetate 3-monooxygenase